MDIKATYGVFNLEMLPLNAIDVSEVVSKSFISNRILTIPSAVKFTNIFADPAPGEAKYLQITYEDKVYNILEDAYSFDIKIDLATSRRNIFIVYYLYINENSNWRAIVSGQLLQLKGYGILSEADLYVHITDTGKIPKRVKELVLEIVPEAILSFSAVNQYEYPGIKLVYDLAQANPDSTMLYFHSKGMSYNVHTRIADELMLLTFTFSHWRKKMEILKDPAVNKIGIFPAMGDDKTVELGALSGWVWFNFWYAKASYIINCQSPIVSSNRWYYEVWLGMHGNNASAMSTDCKSLYSTRKRRFLPKKDITYFTALQAVTELVELKKMTLIHNGFYKE